MIALWHWIMSKNSKVIISVSWSSPDVTKNPNRISVDFRS